ncbi:MAG TPA: ATP-binding protein [candidate division Zixibacteria bacterium]|nr:ATP-binding protein [candidate division Zixibacteria bacterium]
MANSSLYQYASKYAQKAYEQDQAGNYKAAYQNYLKAAEILQQLLSFTSNPQLKNMYFLKAKEYLARAKELKDSGMQPVETSGKRRKSSKKSSGEDTGDSDEEKDELEEAIDEIIVVEKPNVKMSQVAGLEEAKRALREAIILPMKRPDLFKGARNPWRGILLFGAPGTGKTLLARAVATEVDATFFNVSASSIISKWLGESEKLVQQLFETAKQKQPALIFIDEVDSIASARGGGEHDAMRRVKTTLMTQMSGVTTRKEDRIVVIGATNLPWEIDPAFRSRFEKRIYINLPDLPARAKIFEIHTKGVECDDTVDFQLIGEMSDGYSGRDIQLICREAVMMPVRELDISGALDDPNIQARQVTLEDFLAAFEKIKPSVAPEELLRHRDWAEEFGSI